MKRMTKVTAIAAVGAILGSAALAQDKTTSASQAPRMTKEQRMKMATAHEQMAACLRSDRALTDCHDEMMKSCEDAMGAGMCPMMGMGMGGHGMMHRGQQTQTAPTPPSPKK